MNTDRLLKLADKAEERGHGDLAEVLRDVVADEELEAERLGDSGESRPGRHGRRQRSAIGSLERRARSGPVSRPGRGPCLNSG